MPSTILARDPAVIGIALRDLSADFRARSEAAMASEGVTFAQATALYLVASRTRITLTELAELMATTVPNASGTATRLEKLGLIARARSDDDRRVTLLSVTSLGEKRLERVIEHSKRVWGEMFGGVSADEIEQLARILAKLSRAR